MLELPEVLTLAAQLKEAVSGAVVEAVLPPSKPHKFCWYCGDPADYHGALAKRRIVSAEGFGMFAELVFDGGHRLCVDDGVNVRLIDGTQLPKAYQLLIRLDDGRALAFSVQMYGGIQLHDGRFDNAYYQRSRTAVSPLSEEFKAQYWETVENSRPNLSAKALMATEQRFPGIGNGVLQDILFEARIHPKRKLAGIDHAERETLLGSAVSVLGDMFRRGGRDTEKDLYGRPGGYPVRMAKGALVTGCPACGGPVTKEAYLGGSVYYCPHCQKPA